MTVPSDLQFALESSLMGDHSSTQISLRKQPKQARSTELIAQVLEAAVQVLAKEWAQRSTTARVAKATGGSTVKIFMQETLPGAPEEIRALAVQSFWKSAKKPADLGSTGEA